MISDGRTITDLDMKQFYKLKVILYIDEEIRSQTKY